MSFQSAQLQISADTIKVSGALTFVTVADLWQQSQSLFMRAQKKIRFDLQAVEQSDSAGVALMLAWVRAAHSHNQTIQFISLPEQIRAIIQVCGLQAILLSKESYYSEN